MRVEHFETNSGLRIVDVHMNPVKPVSPYLRRPLRSLQEVLQGRGDQLAAAKADYDAKDAIRPAAGNNNLPLLVRRVKSA